MTRQRKLGNKEQKNARLKDKDETSSYSRAEVLVNQFESSWIKAFGLVVLSAVVICLIYLLLTGSNESFFASKNDIVKLKWEKFPCSKDYEKRVSQFKDCAPKTCGRLVTDEIISREEASQLLQTAKESMAIGGLSHGASVLILDSGMMAHSSGEVFNLYNKLKRMGKNDVFTEQDFQLYKRVREKIQLATALNFGIEAGKLHLTHPILLARKTENMTDNCDFHIDQEIYSAFHYTSVLYLNDYGDDFRGGRFKFAEKPFNLVMEPKSGRLTIFTSGAENIHCVEKVTSGVRFAMIIAFTCDEFYGIEDPSLSKLF